MVKPGEPREAWGRWCFNPRPRAGSDSPACRVSCPRGKLEGALVSIHAPAREATLRRGPVPVRLQGRCRTLFQSTPPRGKRLEPLIRRASCGFNPRPRAGSDSVLQGSRASRAVFQSTPPRGKRLRGGRCMQPSECIWCFNPRPRAGSDCAIVTRYAIVGNR